MVGVERGRGRRGKEGGGSLPFGFFFSPLHLPLLDLPRRLRYSVAVHVLPFACTRARLANTKFSLTHRASNSFHIRTVSSLRADEIKLWLTPSAKQRRNPCSGLPAVYPDLSTRHDWPVKKGLCFVCRDHQSG